MKISIAIEATPEEVRETIGLPDLQEVQKTFIGQLSQQVKDGKIDNSSLMELMNPKANLLGRMFFDAAMKNMEFLSKPPTKKSESSTEPEETKEEDTDQ